jgi:hypothetical protein
VVPVRVFEQHVLPRPKFTKEGLEKIHQEVELQTIKKGSQRKWRVLDRSSGERNRELFTEFAKIENCITEAATNHTQTEPSAEFTSKRNEIPKGFWPDEACPDGAGSLLSSKHCTYAHHWMNVFQVKVFKKSEYTKDVSKVL